MKTIVCSACLLGYTCRYDGAMKSDPKILALCGDESVRLVPVCPEVRGGLGIPREPAELQSDGRVLTRSGKDVTEAFQRGAQNALDAAKCMRATEAILKQRSPSCGCGQIYDGSFSGTVIPGDGITTALLKQNGISVRSNEEL